MKTRSFFTGLLLLACTNLFTSCSGLSSALQNGSGDTGHPVPRTVPAEDTEVAYVRQQGRWFQFRMKLEDRGPTAKDENNSYRLHFKAEASVWQFNSKSGEYDARRLGSS